MNAEEVRQLLKARRQVIGSLPRVELARQHREAMARKTRLGLRQSMETDPSAVVQREALLIKVRRGQARIKGLPIYGYPIGPQKPVAQRSEGQIAHEILEAVALKWELTVADVLGNRRFKSIVMARQEACYEVKRELDWSFPRIGRLMGGRDHSTIIHSVWAHANRNGLPHLTQCYRGHRTKPKLVQACGVAVE